MNIKLCGCGKPTRYMHGDLMSCNKYMVCPKEDDMTLADKFKEWWIEQGVNLYGESVAAKAAWDYQQAKIIEQAQRIEELEDLLIECGELIEKYKKAGDDVISLFNTQDT